MQQLGIRTLVLTSRGPEFRPATERELRRNGYDFASSAIASTGMAKTAETVQSMFVGPVFGPLLKVLGADKVATRASLCASQLVGLGIMRYGIRSEPLHSMSVDAIVDAIGPTMQRYLVGDITR